LDTLINLKSLSLSANNIGKIQNLENLKGLERIWLRFNKIKILEGIFGQRELKEIKLGKDAPIQTATRWTCWPAMVLSEPSKTSTAFPYDILRIWQHWR
jgi:Leucine-rich repeat (LRR) protein